MKKKLIKIIIFHCFLIPKPTIKFNRNKIVIPLSTAIITYVCVYVYAHIYVYMDIYLITQ